MCLLFIKHRGYLQVIPSSHVFPLFNKIPYILILFTSLHYNFLLSLMGPPQEELTIEDQRFQQILGIDGIMLQESYRQEPLIGMFPNAETFPEFFEENLVSDDRVLKQFLNNCHNNIRVFYYQFLRLGYEIQAEVGDNKKFITNFKRIVFNPQFQILFTEETEQHRQFYNDFQFKRFFAQFLMLLDKQHQESPQEMDIQKILGHYPIMDMVFIHILRSLLATLNINEEFDVKIPTEIVFEELSNILGLKVTSYGNCWKFEDSDMFCYEENQNEIYLAYIPGNGEEYEEEEESNVQPQPRIVEQQSIEMEDHVFMHPDAIKADSKIIYQMSSDSPNKAQPTGNNYHKRQSSISQKDTPQFLNQNYHHNLHNQNINTNQHSKGYQQSSPPVYQNNPLPYGSYAPPYNTRPSVSETQRSSYSKPTNSMISENFQFIDYLGVSTTEKHRIPKRDQDTKPLPHIPRSNKPNSYEDYFGQTTPQTISERNYQRNEPPPKFESKYKPPAYYSNQTYQYRQQNDYSKYDESTASTAYKHDKFQPLNNTPLPFFKYRNVISTIQYQDEPLTPHRQQDMFTPVEVSRDFRTIYEEGKQMYPVRPVTKFHPVSPTPMPDLTKYRTKKEEEYKQNTSKPYYPPNEYQKPYSESYQPNSSQDFRYQYQIPSTPAYTYPRYQSAPFRVGSGDYDSDFTSPQILSILRSPNRDNIYKIKESMKGIRKGEQIPQRINLMRSAIYENTLPQTKDGLYRNESRSQFQYQQKDKRSLGNRFNGNSLDRGRLGSSSLQRS